MYTTIDCKTAVVRHFSELALPWITSEKDWAKTHQYYEGRQFIRDFQHAASGIVVSVRDTGTGLSLDMEQSDASLKALGTNGILGVDPADYIVSVTPVDSIHGDRFVIQSIANTFYMQNGTVDDEEESNALCKEAWFALFPDLNVKYSSSGTLVSGAPGCEIWRRLDMSGFGINETAAKLLSNTAVHQDDMPDLPYASGSAWDHKIEALAKQQAIDLAAQQVELEAKKKEREAARQAKIAANPTVTPNGGRTPNALPTLRRLSGTTVATHSSNEEAVHASQSNLDLSAFTETSWQPIDPTQWPATVQKILAKQVLSVTDLRHLSIGFSKLESPAFIELSTIALTLMHPSNPGVKLVVKNEKNRRVKLGETVEYSPVPQESYSLDFM